MSDHPIQGLMKTAMESIKDMVDVNTIVGDAVETPDGTVILPISRVSFGFAAGGGNCEPDEILQDQSKKNYAFGGGSGAGVSVKPVGFLVCSPVHGVRFMPVEGNLIYDRIIDLVPKVLSKLQDMLDGSKKDQSDDMDELAKTAETQSH
ncbi:GerW family sporulation protein [Pelosinus propionicus]|uniref:Sporulation protein YtfJ n=1 Tax=Pelosinus propionicus DSM 13327 TaxID=1123291 RepID=A0A1I4KPS6_9FIRM|nr:GerW family sporulation protein [Pelosinus propionicus]SFL80764.1 sporulation protein YtfJ [Pelosinus propionicus DSM 13327]